MTKLHLSFFLLIISISTFSQDDCASAVPFCNDFGSPETVVNGNTAEAGPDYGCLTTQPNPSWNLLKIQNPGILELEISQVDDNGVGIDVDFICYGPFADPNIACANGLLTATNTVACSYSTASIEYLTINNAQVGDYYLILITNYAGTQGTLTFRQTNDGDTNSGKSDCSIVCNVSLESDKTVCINNDYTIETTLGNTSISPTYKWFKNDVEIAGETEDHLVLHSTGVPSMETYKVSIHSDDCENDADDEIVINYVDITPNLKLDNLTTLELCDNDNDGFDTFDLTLNNTEIANSENVLDYTFTFFKDEDLTQQINNPTNYTNTVAYNETIYVSVSHNTFISCEAIAHFEIHAIDSPKATQLDDWFICDDDNDGFYEFDLESLKPDIYNGQEEDKYAISFHATQQDAGDNTNDLPLLYTNMTPFTSEGIFIRIENIAIPTCYEVSSFNIKVIRTPEITQIPSWIVCDDADNDGYYTFDLLSLENDILNGQDENEINISFYNSQEDADLKILPLDTNYINKNAFEQEEVFFRLESNELEMCYATSSFYIQVIENPVFEIVEDTKYICTNLTSQTVNFEIENMHQNYTYSWQDIDGNEKSTSTILTVTQAGDYTITATTTDGNECVTTKTVHLLPAAPATDIQFTMNEYWEAENFIIDVQVLGSGLYQYALDDVNGSFQEDSQLVNVSPGVHTIFVKEINDCGVTSKTIDIFGFSPFFSPNGDGKHDIWKVQGINFKSTAKIYIFDRYGKLMYQFHPAFQNGWNGLYNGKTAPEGEYWFTAEMINNSGASFIRKGHFSLKRTNN